MSKLLNCYVPKFVLKDLPWYERDGLMTWFNQCEDFLRDTDQHYNEAKIINLDIIRRECCGEEVRKDPVKHYQTLNDKAVSDYPKSEHDKVLFSAF